MPLYPVSFFSDHDRKLNLVVGSAVRVTDHDRLGGADHRTGRFEKETHALNFCDLIA